MRKTVTGVEGEEGVRCRLDKGSDVSGTDGVTTVERGDDESHSCNYG